MNGCTWGDWESLVTGIVIGLGFAAIWAVISWELEAQRQEGPGE